MSSEFMRYSLSTKCKLIVIRYVCMCCYRSSPPAGYIINLFLTLTEKRKKEERRRKWFLWRTV